MVTVLLQDCGFFKLQKIMLGALAICHLLMPVALTSLDYHYTCLWHFKSLSFGYEKERKKERQIICIILSETIKLYHEKSLINVLHRKSSIQLNLTEYQFLNKSLNLYYILHFIIGRDSVN
jgi:hypothetical protein